MQDLLFKEENTTFNCCKRANKKRMPCVAKLKAKHKLKNLVIAKFTQVLQNLKQNKYGSTL
jgi:hypothetical protein